MDGLIKIHSKEQDFSVSDQELSFRSVIGDVACTIVYRLENGKSVSALCFVNSDNLKFVEALKQFSALTHYFLDGIQIKHTSLRLNGIQILGKTQAIDTPLNYIRISGEWKAGYDFEARIDGSYTDASIDTSNTNILSITISRSSGGKKGQAAISDATPSKPLQ